MQPTTIGFPCILSEMIWTSSTPESVSSFTSHVAIFSYSPFMTPNPLIVWKRNAVEKHSNAASSSSQAQAAAANAMSDGISWSDVSLLKQDTITYKYVHKDIN
jgi:hypothetical protein